jgi:hypothetical protein
MKFKFIIGISTLLLLSNTAEARLKIPMGEREVIEKVYDLPDNDSFLVEDGKYIDIGRIHKEYNIAYILPLYISQEPRLVGYVPGKDEYYDLTEEQTTQILNTRGLKKENLTKLGFYTQYGGKVVGAILLGLIIWGMIPSKKKKVEPTQV